MSYWEAVTLGIVQGLTEFLPVSSSGHLVLAQKYLGLTGNMMNFDIFVHFGTLLAVLVVFRKVIIDLIYGSYGDLKVLVRRERTFPSVIKDSRNLSLVAAIVIGTIPAAIVGLTLEDHIELLFSDTIAVIAALFFTGTFLIGTFYVRYGEKYIAPLLGLGVGLAQATAIIPGISRSGATIAAALFLGIKREEAGVFSFLLAIPAIAGATLLAVKDVVETGLPFTGFGPDIVGAAFAFLTGWFSLVILMKIVRKGKLGYFGFYCYFIVLLSLLFFSK